MKTKLHIIPFLLAAVLLLSSLLASATDRYTESMQKQIQLVYTAKTPDELQQAIHTLERIGESEKNKWEPYYYASFGRVMQAMREATATQKDQLLDQALTTLSKADKLSPNNTEIVALEGFVHMIRVAVDPATRGQQYSGMAFQSFGKALAIDPNNPRALALLAQMQFGTAQFFGSPTTEACQTLDKALIQFDSYKSDNPLAPKWGRETANELKKQCGK